MIKVLFLGSDVGVTAANEAGQDRIDADYEAHLLTGLYSDNELFKFISHPQIPARDLSATLITSDADIVHIACHGSAVGLLFRGSRSDEVVLVSTAVISDALQFCKSTKLLYIDACQSDGIAQAVQNDTRHNLHCTIGHRGNILSESAYEGAYTFHKMLRDGYSISAAFTAMSQATSSRGGSVSQIFPLSTNLAAIKLVPDPVQIVARFKDEKSMNRNAKDCFEIEFGLYNLPSDSLWTACFFTTADDHVNNGNVTLVKDSPGANFLWTSDYANARSPIGAIWHISSNIEIYAAYVLNTVVKSTKTSVKEALTLYYLGGTEPHSEETKVFAAAAIANL